MSDISVCHRTDVLLSYWCLTITLMSPSHGCLTVAHRRATPNRSPSASAELNRLFDLSLAVDGLKYYYYYWQSSLTEFPAKYILGAIAVNCQRHCCVQYIRIKARRLWFVEFPVHESNDLQSGHFFKSVDMSRGLRRCFQPQVALCSRVHNVVGDFHKLSSVCP